MKKKSRFLTGLLSAVMALSLFALPASAEEGAVANTDTWGNQKGSITIHKYEYNEADTRDANGEKIENEQTGIPADATPLNGVTFEIYQVQDRDALAKYYNNEAENPTYFTDYSVYYSAKGNSYTVHEPGNESKVLTPLKEDITKKVGEVEGIAQFTGLDLGLYLVVEKEVPQKVTTKISPFLVAVPITQPSDTSKWMYNIHVYPKNGTNYGDVTISKKGYTGNTDDGMLSGVVFKLYKKNDKGIYQPVTENDKTHQAYGDFVTGSSGEMLGKIKITDLSQGEYRLVEDSFTTATGYIVDQTPYDFTINADGKLVVNDVQANSNEIEIVNNRPDLDKTVYNDAVNENNGYAVGSDYSVGDLVPYQITIEIPQNITKLTTFTVTDTPEKLQDQKDTIEITDMDATEEDDKVVNPSVDGQTIYVVESNQENGFIIKFTPANMGKYAGHTLVISYEAKLMEGADQTTTGNPNKAELTYTNKVGGTSEGEDESKNTIKDETVVYTFAIRILKTNAEKTPLEGATFDLYKKLEEDEEVPAGATVVEGNGAKELGLDSKYKWVKVDSNLVSAMDTGLVTTNKGLANGTYYLVETKAPAGYNLLAKPVEVKLDIAYKYKWEETETNRYDANGNLVKHEVSQKEEKFDPTEGGNVIGSQKGETVEQVIKGVHEVDVINRKGPTLPVTGGFGTLLFSCIGVLLVVGGVGVLMSTKKKKGNA